ncbi:MAG: serine/threonine-protein kinase, partial [Planctomycetota bacterium]
STLSPPTPGTVESKAYDSLRARFLQEAWVTAGLEHPGIVPVYELGENSEGVPYYTMRFVGGRRTLETAIDEAVDLEARFDLLEPFLKVCDTIRYAHSRGVVHRDLKPDHIALGEFGEVVVLDWGLAKVRGRPDFGRDLLRERIEKYRDAADLTTAANALGTPGYMAPEAARGRTAEVDEKADIFSLGAILYRILTRRLPYPAGHFENDHGTEEEPVRASEVEPGVPEELSRICARALAVDRDRRTDDVDRLAEALRDWRRERTVEREVAALLREASTALAGPGDPPLDRLDRVSALCSRALHLRPDDRAAAELAHRAGEARARAIQARETAVRKRLIRRVALPVFLVAVIASLTAGAIEIQRREAVRGETRVAAALKSARALALAQASEMVEPDDPMLSLLLAREAGRSAPLFPVVTRLHEAIAGSRERVVIRGHADQVNTAVFSPRGDRLLTSSDDETARVWDLEGRAVTVMEGHDDRVRAAAFSADGKWIATVSDDMTLRLHDPAGTHLWTHEGHEDYVVAVEFSKVGERLLTVSWDRTARLWSVADGPLATFREPAGVPAAALFPDGARVVTASRSGEAHVWRDDGTRIATLSGHTDTVADVAVSPTGDRILTVSRDGTARLWSPSGEAIAVLLDHDAGVHRAAFSPDGRRFLTGAEDGVAILWSASGEFLARLAGHDQRVNDVAFSPTGDRIALASDDGRVSLWSGEGKRLATLGAHSAEVLSVAFNPGGDRVASTSADGTVRIWETDEVEVALFRGHGDEVESAAFSPDGTRVLTASDDGTARLWHSDGRPIAVLPGHESYLTVAAFAPAGDAILTAAWDGTALLWNRDEAQAWRPTKLTGHATGIWTGLFSPDGKWVLTASEDHTARLWDREGTLRATLPHPGSVIAAAFSPDSRRIVTSGDRRAWIWSVDGSEIGSLTGHEGRVVSVAYSPDGRHIATSSWDRTARLWSADGTPVVILDGHGATVEDAVFSPSGDRVMTAASDGIARVFDLSGRLRARLEGHPRGIALARFSPDGRTIVTAAGRIFGSPDATARLWTADGAEIAVLEGHAGRVSAVTFSPDGRRILTASADGTARLWLVEVEDLLRLADERVTRDLTPEERRRHVTVMEPSAE